VGIIAAVALAVGLGLVLVVNSGQAVAEATEAEQQDEQTEVENEAEGEDAEQSEDPPVPVEVVEVASGDIASYISATANLVPEDQVKVLAEAEGRIAELRVDEGDNVRRGQVLATLVKDDAEIALAKTEVKAETARHAFERAEETRGQGLISAEAFDQLKMEHHVAEQEVAEARWRLDKTVIRAPFTGVLTERLVTLGQHLRPGDELFSVASFDPLVARIYLPESDVLELELGREVKIALAAGAGVDFAGRIRQIAPVVDVATGTVKVTVEAIQPPNKVRPGAFVNISIVREQHSQALLLPRESVIRELRTANVFVAENGTAVKHAVEIGLEDDEMVEVLSGIEKGDLVIVAGQGGLDDGQKVKIL
jgi:membrane fusion protein (multidrug efflux system)